MKKVCSTQKVNNLKGRSFPYRSPLLKAVSLGTAMTALLSSVSPVVAANFSPTEMVASNLKGTKNPNRISLNATYGNSKSHGSIAVGDRYHTADDIVISHLLNSDDIVISYLLNSKTISVERISEKKYEQLHTPHSSVDFTQKNLAIQSATWSADGRNAMPNVGHFYLSRNNPLTLKLNNNDTPEECKKQPDLIGCNISGLAWDGRSAAEGGNCVDYKICSKHSGIEIFNSFNEEGAIIINSTFGPGGVNGTFGKGAKAAEGAVAMGQQIGGRDGDNPYALYRGAQALGRGSIAIGNGSAVGVNTQASIAIGIKAQVGGHSARDGVAKDGIAIGKSAISNGDLALALGAHAKVIVDEGVALGAYSVADVPGGIAGYDPGNIKPSVHSETWKSSAGAVSVGTNYLAERRVVTRQIVNLAAGTQDTDAVNVAQLKSLKKWVEDNNAGGKGWKLSVNGANATDVASESTVDFSSTGNLKITKDPKNKVTFDLAQKITVNEIKMGNGDNAILTPEALQFKGGSSIGSNGIHAGNKKIMGLADGILDDDAVNKKQLDKVSDFAKKGWVLTLNDGKPIQVASGSQIGFLSRGGNLTIKNDGTGNILFSLTKDITVDSITAGGHILNGNGLQIKDNGPGILTSGINAGDKKITGVLAGALETDAVNFGQLKALKDELEKNDWIQQDSETKKIKIGAKAEGAEISFLNKESKERTLSGLKDGTISATSTEAITGKQLYGVDKKLSDVSTNVDDLSVRVAQSKVDIEKIGKNTSTYLGGGADLVAGKVPTYKIQEKSYNNVGAAFIGVDGSITDLYSKLASVAGDSLVQQEASETKDGNGRITIGAKVGGTEINLLNKESKERTLSGLKDGTVSATSTEAITGKQLYDVDKKLSEYLGGGVDLVAGKAPTYKIQDESYNNVGAAFAGIDGSLSDIYKELSGVGGKSLVQQEASGDGNGRITVGAKTGGTEISLLNKESGERTLSGLKDGTISATSTEAITGKQLYGVDKKLSDVSTNVDDLSVRVAQSKVDIEKIGKNTSTYLGGGADLVAGKVPTYKIQEKSYNNVGAAFIGVDGSITDLYSKLASVAGDSLVQQEASETKDGNGRITIGAKVGGTKISLLNKESKERTLSGLKDGTVSTISTEAITGKQLYETNSKVAEYFGGNANYKDGEWTDPTFTVNVLKEDGSTEQKKYKNVANALEGLSSSFTTVVENNLVQQEKSETKDGNGRITIGAKTGGTEISLLNKESGERTLSGLKDGTISATSTEAITGKQLYGVDKKLSDVSTNVDDLSVRVAQSKVDIEKIGKNTSTYLGGGADLVAGKVPTYKIQEKSYNNVGAAFIGVDGSITDLYSKLASVAGDSLVQQEASETKDGNGRITIGAKVGGTKISLLNKESKERTLSGLKDGTVSTISTEAITGKQLYETNSKVAEYFGGNASYKDGEWTDPTFTINVLKEDGSTEQKKYKNVADALNDVSGSLTTVVENTLIQQEESEDDSGRITIGAKVGGTEISLLNKESGGRTLSGLKDGTVSSISTEAITGKQLYETNSKVAEYFGGNANYKDGEWTDPTFTVNVLKEDGSTEQKKYKNVANALEGLSSSFTTVVENNLVQQEKSETKDGNGRITIGAKTGGTEINLLNKDSKERTLSGLKDGTISATSTEAITGKQLYGVDKKLSDVSTNVDDLSVRVAQSKVDIEKIGKNTSTYLGGGADLVAGKVPTYKIQEKSYNNVGAAFAGIDGSLSDIYKELSGVGGKSLVQQEASGDGNGRITIGAKTGGTEISLLNKESGERTLSGLKDGTVSTISTEAITGKQLYETNSKVAEYFGGNASYKDGEWTDPTFTINVLKEDGSTEQKKYKNVADALNDVSGSLTTVVENTLIQQEESEDDSGRITIGAKVGGTEISLLNKESGGRTLSGLKDGTVSSISTEAITGKQLYETNSKVAEYFGGNANYKDGKWTDPTFTVNVLKEDGSTEQKKYKNVANALEGLSSSFTTVVENNLVQQEKSETKDGNGRITIGAKTGGTEINLLNKDSKERTLSGLKDGTISATSTEAITGKQLYGVDKKLSDVSTNVDDLSVRVAQSKVDIEKIGKNTSTYLGGGADLVAGKVPTYKIQEKSYNNVGAAFAGIDGSLSDIYKELSGVGGKSLVQQEASGDGSGRITVGAKTGGTKISLLNKESQERTLSGLKDGTVSTISTEAITGKQLYETNSKVAEYFGGNANYKDGEWTDPTFTVNVLKEDGSTEQKKYKNVANALEGLSSSFTTVVENNLVQQEKSETKDGNGRITIGAKTGGTEINLLNKESKERTLSGLKDGTISSTSTEAITGKQLYGVDKKLSDVSTNVDDLSVRVAQSKVDIEKIGKNTSTYLGGGADLVAGKSPTYKIQEKSYNNVGAAFAGIDGSLSDIYNELSGVGGKSLVQQEASGDGSGRITVGAKTGGTEISLLNKESGERTLSGLKDGKVSEKSTEAVTGKQLFAVEGKLTDTNNKLTVTDNKVSELNKDVTQVKTDVSTVKTDLSKFGTNISSYLGGGADLVAGKSPTYKIQDESYNNVGAAFAGIDGSLSDIYKELSGVGGKSLVQQEASGDGSGRITVGAKTGGTEISLLNKESGERTLSGLKDGKVSEKSTEAVTGKQLFAVEGKLTDTNNKLTVTDNKVSELNKDVTQVKTDVSTVKTDLSKFGTNISSYLGGGADLVAGKAPTYKIQDESYNSVGATFAGIDGSLSDIYNELSGAGTKGLVQQEVSGRITIGAKTGGTEISLLNKESGERTLSGLKDGKVSEKSTEAVTGKQLFSVEGKLTDTNNKLTVTDNKVSELDKNVTQVKTDVSTVKTDLSKFGTNISSYLGGGADLVAGKAPTYKIQDESYNSVGATFAGIDGSLSDIYNELSGAGTKGLVQQEVSGRITIGAKTGGTEISLLNKESGERTLSGLKDGKVSEKSTEAVTGKQLFAVEGKLTDTNNKLTVTDNKVSELDKNVTQVKTDVSTVKTDLSKFGTNISSYLGGGADLVAGKAPTYKIQDESYNSVGAAFAGIDGSLSDIYNELSGAGTKGLVQQEASGRITIGAKTGGTEISLLNKESGERTLSGLKDGTISSTSTEAITGKQLYGVDKKLSDVSTNVDDLSVRVAQSKVDIEKIGKNTSTYLGGGADLVAGKSPTYKIQEKSYNNVGAAFAGIDGSLSDIYNELSGVGGKSLVQQEASGDGSGRITVGAKTGGTEISLLNKESGERTLSGLKDGKVSEKSTEAVTGKQLFAVEGKLTDTNNKLTVTDNKVSELNKDVTQVKTDVSTVKTDLSKFGTNISSYLGGGADLVAGKSPTYKIQDESYNNVGAAFAGIDGSLSDIYKELSGVGGKSLVQQEASGDGSGRITVGAKTGGTEISLLNKESGERTLSGLKDGKVSEKSTEAVTGKQLFAVEGKLTDTNNKLTVTDNKVSELNKDVTQVKTDVSTVKTDLSKFGTNISSYLGGGADLVAGKAPTYKIQDESYNSVGATFAGIDGSLSDIYNELSGAGTKGLVQQEVSGRITIGAKTGGTEISLLNKESGERTLSGLKDGKVSEKSTEAVTGKQLFSVEGKLTDTNNKLTVTDNKVSELDKNVTQVKTDVSTVKTDLSKFGTNISSYLGGGADLVAGKAPTYKIQDESYNNVGAAFAGIDGSLSDIYKELSGAGTKGLVQQEVSGRITIGAKTGGTEINLANQLHETRTLSGLKDGKVSEKSTEAVTGKQLFSVEGKLTDTNNKLTVTDNKVSELDKNVTQVKTDVSTVKTDLSKFGTNISSYLGGGADLVAGKAPTYKIQDESYNSVGAAFAGIDGSLSDIYNELSGAGTKGLVQQEASGRITIGAKTGGTEISLLNKESGERTLSGLKDGKVSEKSTEAVTGKQLFAVEGKLTDTNNKLTVTDNKVSELNKDVTQVKTDVSTVKTDLSKFGTNISSYLGGGADLVAGKAPTYKIQDESYNSVGATFAGIDGSLSDIYNELSGAGTKGLVQQEVSGRITIGAKTGGTEINLANQLHETRTLSGLKDGKVSEKSTEAVTGKQLFSVEGKLTDTNNKLTVTDNKVSELDKNVTQVKTDVSTVKTDLSKFGTNISSYLGGGADLVAGKAPTYKIQDESYNSVGATFAGIDDSLSDIYNELSGAGTKGLVQQEVSGRITIGAKTGGTEINLANQLHETRTLSGLKDGKVSEKSTEAVTGKQLFAVEGKLTDTNNKLTVTDNKVSELDKDVTQVRTDLSKFGTNISSYLGGGADLVAGKAPTYKIQDESYNSVGATFAGIDSSLSDIYNELSGAGTKGLVQQEVSGRITIGAKTGGTEISLLNKESGERTLSGLKDGKVSEKSTEAVTGKQLFSVEGKLTDTNNKLTVTDNKVSELDKDVTQVKTDVSTVKTDLSKFGTNISSYLGGGADLVAGKAPTYKIQDESYNSVGAAFAGIDGSLSDIYNELSGAGTKGLVQQEASGRITIGAKTGGTEINLANQLHETRTLSGLKDGKVSEKSTEAVTGKQLFAVEGKLTDTNNKLTVTDNKVSELDKNVTQVRTDLSKFGTNISSYLGGGADLVAGKAPTYKIQDESYNSVGATFAGIDGSLSDIYNELSGAGTKGLVQQDGSGRITIGAKTGGTEINLANQLHETRTLSGLKDGKVSEKSTEAVTGKQLFAVEGKLTDTNNKLTVTDNKVSELNKDVTQVKTDVSTVKTDLSKFGTNISSYLGGGADLVAGKAPTYKIQDESYNSVGAAFAGIDGSLSDIYNELSGAGTKGLVQQEASGRITIGAKTGGTEINLANQLHETRTLSGLKDGKVSEKSTEAVTGKQLFAVEGKLTDTNNKLTVTDNKVSELDKNVTQVKTDVSTVKTDLSKFGTNISSYLGGGADLVAGKAPTYKIQDESYNSVGATFAGIDDSLSDIYNELSGAGTKGLVQQEVSGRITIGAKTGGTEINLANQLHETRTLSGLKDGKVSEKSTEAVTGKQLFAVEGKLTDTNNKLTVTDNKVSELDKDVTQVRTDLSKFGTNISSYLGGGADLVAGKAPTYKIQDESYNSVGATFAGIDSSLSDIYNELSGAGTKGLVQQEVSGRITIGAKTGGTEINLANQLHETRTLSGLKDGKVSERSTEAVTGKQLFAVEGKLTDTNNKLTVTDNKVSELDKDVTQVRTDLSKFGTNISSYLGGGADLVAGKAPIYRIQGKELHNVGSAFANVDTTLTQIQNDMSENIDNVEQNGLLWNDSENAFVALHGEKGKEKTESKLKFLLGGNIAKGSTEAITGGQLYETHTKLASYFGGGAGYKHGKWIDPTFKVVQFDSDSKTDGRKYVQYNNIDGAIGGVNKNMEDLDSRLNDVQAEVNNNGLHWNKEIGAYDATHGADKGKITNVADGKLEEGSSDVVTGNQLFETNQNIIGLSDDVKSLAENTSTYLGGGADLSAGKAPTYKIQDESYNNVGAAFAGVDTTLTQLQKDMTANIENVEQNGLLWSDSENAFVALHGEKGKEKTESKLKFLLGGDIAEGSTEAITGNQLYETHTKLASYFGGEAGYNNGVWTSPTFKVVQFNFGDNTDGKKYNQYHNVADAFGGVNESMENLNDRLGNIEQKKEQNGIKWNEEKGAYDASQKGEDGKITNSKLTGVADGAIEKNSSDVVTGNQLWETNQKVDKLEDKVNKFENSVDQMTEGTVQYDKDGDGKKTNKITLVGGDADKPVVIDNVADGKVEKGSKEAINGGQLHEKIEIVLDDAKKYTDEKITDAVSKAKDYTDMKFDILNYNIDGAKQEARQAAAIGLAVSNLRYNEAPGKLSIAISSGVWRSQSAFAFGAGYTSENGNIRSNISVTTAGDHWGVGGGIQFTLN